MISCNKLASSGGKRKLVLAVLSKLEGILSSSPYAANFRPVLKAARDGAVARSPSKLYCYLYGAVHASLMDDETWELVDDQLQRLLTI